MGDAAFAPGKMTPPEEGQPPRLTFDEGLDVCRHWWAASEYGKPYCCQLFEWIDAEEALFVSMFLTTNAAEITDVAVKPLAEGAYLNFGA